MKKKLVALMAAMAITIVSVVPAFAATPAEEVASLLEGTLCRGGTSCPDQLAKALKEYKASL